MTTARWPRARRTASSRSATDSTRGCRISSNGWSGNCASSACTSRVAVSPVESEAMCSSTGVTVTAAIVTTLRNPVEPERRQRSADEQQERPRRDERERDLAPLLVVADAGAKLLVDVLQVLRVGGGERLAVRALRDLAERVGIRWDRNAPRLPERIDLVDVAVRRSERDREHRHVPLLRLVGRVERLRRAPRVGAVGEQEHDRRDLVLA